jgi:hypothetical protein
MKKGGAIKGVCVSEKQKKVETHLWSPKQKARLKNKARNNEPALCNASRERG